MILKQYQTQSLDVLETFYRRCRTYTSADQAFRETSHEWFGTSLRYNPLPAMPEVPYICLRIPTGGGKTLIGGMAIERINRSFLYSSHSITLWLVPSEPIRVQTLKMLRQPAQILRQMVGSALGEITVVDFEEFRSVTPATLNNTNTIIVATMQSFKQEKLDRLTAYQEDGSMMQHFQGISDPTVIGRRSRVDVLRMHHPFIIVDEAHNQGTDLAFETLARFEPCAILELTATPDREHNPSYVLLSVSAATLQAEEMIKLPLELVRRAQWQDALRDGIVRLNALQSSATDEQKETGEYLRPIMLIQAERINAGHETLVAEKVKQALINDHGVPEDQIAIATGTTDELGNEDLLDETSKRRFIITVDKLREGWDCPFAYILCSLRNTNTATAAEQILGRIMRMPYAHRKKRQVLNESYAYVTSNDLMATINSLRDGLVKNGFEQQDAKDLIRAGEAADTDDLFTSSRITSFTVSVVPAQSNIPASLQDKIEIEPETLTVIIKGTLSPVHAKTLDGLFTEDEDKQAVQRAVQIANNPSKTAPAPSETGAMFAVPLLAYKNGDLWEQYEETHLLQGDWKLLDYSTTFIEGEFRKEEQIAEGGILDISKAGKLTWHYFDRIEAELAIFDSEKGWNQVQLVSWLEHNIPEDTVTPEDKAAFINQIVTKLIQDKNFTVDQLNYRKNRLRESVERKIANAKQAVVKNVYQCQMAIPEQFNVSSDCVLIFKRAKYAYNFPYVGFIDLPKHFFPVVGDLLPKGEEFECAQFLATKLDGVKYWLRNIAQKDTSFSLQTSTDRFYPDFVCLLDDGRILVVEYKNERDWDLPDSREKRQIGELWEKRSGTKGLFIMPRGKDWGTIKNRLVR